MMDDLFASDRGAPIEVLPRDGSALYFAAIMSFDEAEAYKVQLIDALNWQHDQAFLHGKYRQTARKVAWHGEQSFAYRYANITRHAKPWVAPLLEIKQRVEDYVDQAFNACLANLYHNGSEGMAWHSDSERELLKHGAIASLSFGAQRRFAFKHKQTGERLSLELAPGSLLVMRGTTQDNWLHRLPPVSGISQPRVNLTFRTMVGANSHK